MVANHGHHEEAFLDSQDITDYPIFNTSRNIQMERVKKDKNKSLVQEELRLLRGIKDAVEDNKESHDRKKEKKFSEHKDKTQLKILQDLDELLKYIKKHVIEKEGSRFSLNPMDWLPDRDKSKKKKKYVGLFNKDKHEKGGSEKEGHNSKDKKDDVEDTDKKASKEKEAVEDPKKKGNRFFKGRTLLKVGAGAIGAVGAGVAAKGLYDTVTEKPEKGSGHILRSALDGAMSGGEVGSFFDGIGAIPGAAIGALGAGSIEAYREYKDDITKELDKLSHDTAKTALSDAKYVLNATSKEIAKYIPNKDSLDFNLRDIGKDIEEYKNKIEDALMSFWKNSKDYIESHIDFPKLGKDIKQGTYRAFDRAENKVGIHASWEPESVSAINKITTGPGAVNRDYAIAVAQMESGGGKNIGNSTSSAKGMYQFIDGTAQDLAKRHNIDISNPYSADTSAKLFQAYTDENKEALKKGLGRESTDPENYMAHFLGAGGALDMIKASQDNPDVKAADINPKAAAANHNMFYSPGRDSHALSAKEFYDNISKKYDKSLASGKEVLAIQEKRFGMNDAGTKDDLTKEAKAAVKPLTESLGRAADNFADAVSDVRDNLEKYSKAILEKYKADADDDSEDITVTGKRRDLNIKPTWLEKNMPATANNWDSVKDLGRSFEGFFDSNALGTTDLSGGDRTFVNRAEYNKNLESNVEWLHPKDEKAVTRAKAVEDITPDFGLTKEQTYEQRRDHERISQRAAEIKRDNQAKSTSSAKDNTGLDATKINFDDVPMFLQDSGIIIINSGRGV